MILIILIKKKNKKIKDTGVLIYTGSAKIHYSNVKNSYFKNGFLHWDENNKEGGGYTINYVNFENNTSESGTIFNFPYLSPGSANIGIYYSTFTNNTASKFGGVIFSGENGNRMVFSNCIFNNNHAKYGNIVYAHSKNEIPTIGDIQKTEISTIPTYFEMNGNVIEEISILSGESIPEGIMCKLNKIYI